MTIPYTYLLKFKPANLFYYGVRFRENCNPDEFWETYFTSSKVIKRLIDEFGKDSFEFEIRKIFNTKRSARDWEQMVLLKIDAENHPKFINRSNNIKGILRGINEYEWCYNPITSNKILIKKGEPLSSEWIRGKRGPCSKSIGCIVAHHPHIKKNKRFASVSDVPDDYTIGSWYSTTKGKIWISNETTNKSMLVSPDTIIPIGWSKGARFVKNKNTCKVHKLTDNVVNCKSIQPDELESYLSNGWVRGNPKSVHYTIFQFIENTITNIKNVSTKSNLDNTWYTGKPNLYKISFNDGNIIIAPWQYIVKELKIPRSMIIYSSSKNVENPKEGFSTKYKYKSIIRIM